MSDNEKKYTMREMVMAQRAAFAAGITEMVKRNVGFTSQMAEDRYPLPKVSRPRVVRDPHIQNVDWQAPEGGGLLGRCNDAGHWYGITLGHHAFNPTSERVRVWADLFANPTEEVEDAHA